MERVLADVGWYRVCLVPQCSTTYAYEGALLGQSPTCAPRFVSLRPVHTQVAALNMELEKSENEIRRRRREAKEHAEQMKVVLHCVLQLCYRPGVASLSHYDNRFACRTTCPFACVP